MMPTATPAKPVLNFDNTEVAFAYKSDKELRQAHFLFSSMGYRWLVALGTRLTPWAIKSGLPIKGIIRNTIFRQFVGGETLEETKPVVDLLAGHHVQVILDYGAEGGQEERGFDHAMQQFIKVIDYAGLQPNIPFMSVKVTGIARFGLLEKLDDLMHRTTNTLVKRYEAALQQLTADEQAEWQRVVERMERICKEAAEQNIGVLVDAEETWIQDPVDALVCVMMDKYNRGGRCLLYNTVQLYRHDRLAFLRAMLEAATQRDFVLGVKLVRGAYMEKERKRAEDMGYPSPIQPDKASCDRDYNEAIQLCIDHLDRCCLILASHNEHSNRLAVDLLHRKGLPANHAHVHFSQLYGMSDHITFNLAAAGCNVSKYLPFGPIEEVIPYLMRRAQENSSVGGQTSRELLLIKKEMKRRGL
jgi:proline dehydrogenase